MSSVTSHTDAPAKELKEVRLAVRVLEAEEIALAHTLETVRANLAIKRARIEELEYKIAPVSRIPSEILAAIFILACGDDRSSPTTLLRVSRFWYKTAMGCSALWASISISSDTLGRAAAYLERAQGSTIDVKVWDESERDWEVYLPLLTTALQGIQRISKLMFATTESNTVQLFLSILPMAAPSLTSFTILFRQPHAWNGSTVQLFPAGAPKLTKLVLYGISVEQCMPPLSRVTFFSWDPHRVHVPLNPYRLMPALTHVYTPYVAAEIQNKPQRTAVIDEMQSNIGFPLGDIVTFALEEPPAAFTLRNASVDTFRSCTLPDTATRLSRTLTLTLYDCAWGTFLNGLRTFFLAFSALETLVLVSNDGTGIWRLDGVLHALGWKGGEAEPVILPRLRRLEVRSNPMKGKPVLASILLDVVRARALAGIPLSTLVLLRSHCNQMEAVALAELRTDVSLEIVDE